MTQQQHENKEYSFPQKVWIAGGIFALIVVVLLLLKATFSVLLLVLAGALIALFFRGWAGIIQRNTHWKEGWCVTASILSTLIIVGLMFWLMGSKVQQQAQQLSETLPKTIQSAKEQLNQSALGQKIVQKLSSDDTQQKMGSVVQSFFRSTFGVLGDLYVVLFVGIFFTASPHIYAKGVIKLVPPPGKKKADEVLTALGSNLKKWLKGKLFAMMVVFVLTAIGLVIMGVPMWLVLALIAGLLNFIPNFGPLIALIPAGLVGLMQSPATALWIAGLYIVVQALESNFITPMVQQKLVKIPPALIIIAQMLMAPLTGGWGLVLATPLMLIVMIVVQHLYINKQKDHG